MEIEELKATYKVKRVRGKEPQKIYEGIAYRDEDKVVEGLMEGEDVEWREEKGKHLGENILFAFARFGVEGRENILKLLLELGANPFASLWKG